MNGGVRVYVSYAWESERESGLVAKLEQACAARGVTLFRDTNRIGYRGSIRGYMDDLACGKHVILVLSDAYFRSNCCMYELCAIHKNEGFRKRVYPVVLKDTGVERARNRIAWLRHWEEESRELDQELKTISGAHAASLQRELSDYVEYRSVLDHLIDVLKDMNTLTQDVHEDTDFSLLLDQIVGPEASAPAQASVVPSSWATRMERDEHGWFADAEFRGVVQRFRWIAPGSFWMGSPESEPRRFNDELQHQVTLTRGFWLADTACTQALWVAIMGSNPSRFQSESGNEHPVENVSWDDVKTFLGRLNEVVAGLGARLPTEAEWEYACRACTTRTKETTPFSVGSQITPEQVNYDCNFPYAGGRKGMYREKTVPVKSLPPNAWGLYEMHGNVYEWCEDRFGEYLIEAVTDPTGPSSGAHRVIRGGSWFDNGRFVRSANRSWRVPAFRSTDVGFRVALGRSGPGR